MNKKINVLPHLGRKWLIFWYQWEHHFFVVILSVSIVKVFSGQLAAHCCFLSRLSKTQGCPRRKFLVFNNVSKKVSGQHLIVKGRHLCWAVQQLKLDCSDEVVLSGSDFIVCKKGTFSSPKRWGVGCCSESRTWPPNCSFSFPKKWGFGCCCHDSNKNCWVKDVTLELQNLRLLIPAHAS